MLLNENSLIETMFDVMPFGVYVVDVQTMKIVHMNRVMKELRGANLTDRICHEGLYDNDAQCIFCRMDEVLGADRKPNGCSVTYDHFDDMEDCWFQIQKKAITWPDGRVVVCVIAVDISELKETQNHLAEAHAELALKNKALEKLSRHKSAFLATISHEIRTPLNAVIGLSDLALKTELNAKQRDYLKKIHTSSNALLRMLNDTLDYSKIEAGKIELEQIPFELPQVLDEVLAMFYLDASRKFIELLLSIDDKVPWFVVGDPFRLSQILSNILGNAVKFTESGEIVVKVNLINKMDHHATLRFAVSDTGIGISERMIPSLFHTFTQESTATTRQYGGTGLGLAICKKMVELMNGTIWVESQKGTGSTFFFEIDLALQPKERFRKLSIPVQISRLDILIADDNPVSLRVLEKMLKNFQCQVTAADSGEEALQILRERNGTDGTFDLLITDWHMKEINGIELAQILRKDPQFASLPIILISAFDKDGELMTESNEAGIHAFLSKPLNLSALFNSIMEIFCHDDPYRMPFAQRVSVETDSRSMLHGKEILLVDDNSINRQVGTEILENLGAIVHVASSGAKAVEMALKTPFDAILMDVSMPTMDGYETTRRIRQSVPHTPIIAMTAHCANEARDQALDAGMNDFLCKPIDPALLAHVLSRVLFRETKDSDLANGTKERGNAPTIQSHHGPSKVNDLKIDSTVQQGKEPTGTAEDRYCSLQKQEHGNGASSDPLLTYFAEHGEAGAPEDLMSEPYALLHASPREVTGRLLDADGAIGRLGGNQKLYSDLLRQFLTDTAPRIDQVQRSIVNSGVEHAAKIVHFIRGVSGNVGLTRLYHTAGHFESCLSSWADVFPGAAVLPENEIPLSEERAPHADGNGSHDENRSVASHRIWWYCRMLASEMEQAIEAVAMWLDSHDSNKTLTEKRDVVPGEGIEVEAGLRTLADLLKSNNALAISHVDEVMAWESVMALDDAREMAHKVASLDFDAALDLLRRIAHHHGIDL